jgi:hypothetical protein
VEARSAGVPEAEKGLRSKKKRKEFTKELRKLW